MKHFTLKELTVTDTGMPNRPGTEEEKNLINLVDRLLDPVREQWGRPIRVNSGYRSISVNLAVGGATTSQHLRGEAADITAGSKENNQKLFKIIAEGHVFDQLIDESEYTWIHVSIKRNGVNRKQILHL
ncbi:MAG: peptidase M15 [Prevotellaceae bacterium]|jgi:hypothetical protein|nr:peptidase M15 [Prevotellaceae bacterium]